MSRTPDQIITDIDNVLAGKDSVDNAWLYIWEIIEDILDSIKLAEAVQDNDRDFVRAGEDVHDTVKDYVVNHYSPGG